MTKRIILSEGLRIIARKIRLNFSEIKKYDGNAEQICRKIVDECWNGKYFQVSTGHFNEFYVRDFGWCTDSLLNLGYKYNVIKTLDYALNIYSKNNRITTTIDPKERVIDIFAYSPDSLAFLIRSLRLANAKSLVKKYKSFLNNEVNHYFDIVFDKDKSIVKENIFFSSMKDHSINSSSCYNNSMVALLSKELNILGLKNPFKKYNLKKAIKDNFWNGEYFLDDLSGSKYISGDANIYPFYAGIFNSKKMLNSAICKIIEKKLDEPFPLKYSDKKQGKFTIIEKLFVQNYEGNALWTHMGPLYIKLLKKVDSERSDRLIQKYTSIIEKHKNYLEVFHPDGSPYKTIFYHSDEGMLWAANYLDLIK